MTRPVVLHVSASARGKADGSESRPFATLEAARDALRRMRRRRPLRAPVRVLVEPGVYRLSEPLAFTPEDGGTARCPVTWSGHGGRPLISGGRLIGGWTPGTINGRPCWRADLPEVRAGRWWFTQLFVNGRRRLRARLPKRGFYHFAGVPEEEAKADTGALFHGAMSARFTPGEVRAFRNLDDIDVVVPDHWYESHLRIASVDEAASVIRFATKGYSRFSRDETGRGTRFRLDHVAEACTDPGDWYLDRASGVLSYIPLPSERLGETRIEAPVLERVLDVRGDPLDPERRVRRLRFEFLDFRHADWELPRENPGCLQSDFNVPAAVRFVGAEDCALYGCRVSQVAGWAVEVLRGCRGNRITACALHDLGGGGVKVGHEGGLPAGWVNGNHGAFRGLDAAAMGWGPCREEPGGRLAGRDRAESSATTVSDCAIHDGGLIFHSAIGVWVGDASRNRIVHNHIWNFSYSGISCGWTWGYAPAHTYDNRIEGNRIERIGHGVLSDMGAIYTLGRQAGTTIRRNFISDVTSYGYGGWGIYPDEGSSWMRIEENVVCGTKTGGFHQHYGRDNLVRGNLFADAVENQVAVSRGEIIRPVVFERNVVQGAGNGHLVMGGGCGNSVFDRNVYAGDPGAPVLWEGKNWEQWRSAGHDPAGQCREAVLLDAAGAAPAAAHAAALKAAGLDPRMVAAVVAEAGPRFRGALPPSLDAVAPEPERRQAIVEPLLWPWEAEWPTADSAHRPWSKLPLATPLVVGRPHVASLTLENRGDAPARCRYRLRVEPASAARIVGPRELACRLEPGGRASLEVSLAATGETGTFRLDAVSTGDGFTTCLFFMVSRILPVPFLPEAPPPAGLAAALARVPAHPLDGNGRPVRASARVAVAGDRLLLRVDAEDAAPSRGPGLWDGSSVELFTAAEPGAPRLQLVLAPALEGMPAEARVVDASGPLPAEGVELDGMPVRNGWSLAASIPFALLKLDPAAPFAMDLVVNARDGKSPDLRRTHFATEQNPFHSSDGYRIVRKGAAPKGKG